MSMIRRVTDRSTHLRLPDITMRSMSNQDQSRTAEERESCFNNEATYWFCFFLFSPNLAYQVAAQKAPMASWNGSCPLTKRKKNMDRMRSKECAIKKKIAQLNKRYTPEVIINVVIMSQNAAGSYNLGRGWDASHPLFQARSTARVVYRIYKSRILSPWQRIHVANLVCKATRMQDA